LRSAQLASLRYQINPHLLFNALNTVSALVLEGDADGAERALMALSVFLRSALAEQTDEDLLLADEIAHQQLYLEIERIRFGDRLRVEVLVPQALAAARVPGLLLQPLVENAVRHGVSRISIPVRIVLRAEAIGGSLRLTVEDDAPASPLDTAPEEGRLPGRREDTCSMGSGLGLGLRNVAARLAARFGDEARCSFGQRSTGGFIAEITMPLRFSPA
jgi:two-component system LytT family sensor kinase